ncbi:MAG: phosphoglycerate dehydrogenase, partial [Chloroflexota bacterium]
MSPKTVVHTALGPNDPAAEESKAFVGLSDVVLVKAGKRRTPAEVLGAVRDADVALCGGEPYTREVFAGAPKLLGVLRYGVGVDTIDLDAATEFGVVVGNYPDFCTREVANHALVLMMCCAKRVVHQDLLMRRDGWMAARTLRSPMGQIHGETLGLVAFGAIARELAKRAQCLEMKVIACDPYVKPEVFAQYGVERVALEELARRSDYVSCHLPLSASTQGMVNAAFFRAMQPTAYFINTSRGPVVDEPALIAALQAGQIAGAGLDVFEKEPLPADSPFLKMDNVVLTSHAASFADETFRAR